ncbi:hypothetical protein JCM10207_005089 [Rhodosporidiobolus poonsookiae]
MAPPTTSSSPPPNFPSTVAYLSTPLASKLLPAAARTRYCTPSSSSTLPNPPPRLAIRLISDPAHPANGQRGLFNATGKAIPRGTWIRDYVGVVHTEGEADPLSDYDLSLERRVVEGEVDAEGTVKVEVVGIDASKMGNEARFCNDYRGTGAPRPNALFELRHFDLPSSAGGGKGTRMAVWAGPHGIDKGAEVLVSYGRGFWEKRMEEAEKEKERKREEEEKKAVKAGEGKVKKGGAAKKGAKGKGKGKG